MRLFITCIFNCFLLVDLDWCRWSSQEVDMLFTFTYSLRILLNIFAFIYVCKLTFLHKAHLYFCLKTHTYFYFAKSYCTYKIKRNCIETKYKVRWLWTILNLAFRKCTNSMLSSYMCIICNLSCDMEDKKSVCCYHWILSWHL